MGVTYSAQDWQRAQQAWADGEFGEEWDGVRAAARARGFIFPPAGSRHDSAEDDRPSQRAIVHRATEDTPRTLLALVGKSRTWSQLVDLLIHSVNAQRERLGDDGEELRLARARADAPRDAERLAGILRRLP